MTKMGATFGFAFGLLLLFVNFDVISSVPTSTGAVGPVIGGYGVSSKSGFAQVTTTDIKIRRRQKYGFY